MNHRTSPKKARKPQQRSLALRRAIATIAADYERMSVRQLYYQLVARGDIEKTEAAYKRVCDVLAQMRLDGSLPYRKIADGHRTRRTVYAHSGLRQAMENAQEVYRRNYWLDQPLTVEVWCEKDALTGVIQPVCEHFGVTYVATRGFPSITLRFESAQELIATGKPACIFYFGDHDASGRAISANLEAELRHHGADVEVKRVALEPKQILTYGLPTRPGKKSDSRHVAFANQYGDAAVELDALPPDVLTELVEDCIVTKIDGDKWLAAKHVERLERETFASLSLIEWKPGTVYHLSDEVA